MQTLIDKCVEPSRILLVILLALVLAQTGWFFVTGPAGSQTATNELSLPDQQSSIAQAERSSVLSVSAIGALNLFGKTDVEGKVATQNNFNASQTRLRLELQAVFQAEHAKDSAAIVAEAKRPGVLYKVGKKLPGNAILKEVYTDRIVLQRGDIYETLRFPKSNDLLTNASGASNSGLAATSRTPNSAANTRLRTDSSVQMRTNTPAAPHQQKPDSGSLNQVVKQFQTNLKNDPKTTLAQIGVTPVSAGNSQGYRLGGLASSPYLRQTGLQANDVILSVNNQAVGNIQQDQLRIANVLAQGSARLEVQRGDRKFFVTASLK